MNQQETTSMTMMAKEEQYDDQLQVPHKSFLEEHQEKLIPLPLQNKDGDAVSRMQEQCYRRMSEVLSNWQVADVRTVPGVMCQVRCGRDEFDQSIEYQINWFFDCTETFLHNHRNSFDTYCLEGEYIEKLWEIVNDDDDDGGIIYQFRRNSDSTFDLHKTVHGTLCHIKTRHHFPGNLMHVDTCQFHSISPIANSSTRVLTFLVKRNYLPVRDMFVLSTSPDIVAPKDDMRPATKDERQAIYEKLQQVLEKSLHK